MHERVTLLYFDQAFTQWPTTLQRCPMFNSRLFFRTVRRNRFFTLVNIVGLTLGFGVFMYAMLLVRFESSYDRHIPDADRIYRVNTQYTSPQGIEITSPLTADGVCPVLAESIHQIEQACNIWFLHERTPLRHEDKRFIEEEIAYVDPAFLEMLAVDLHGVSAAEALKDPSAILVSETVAAKYFGTADPVGKIMIKDMDESMRVAGVFTPDPLPSHLREVDFYCPLTYLEYEPSAVWKNEDNTTYIKLIEGATVADIEGAVRAVTANHVSPERLANGYELQFEPIRDIHLYSTLSSIWGSAQKHETRVLDSLLFLGFAGVLTLLAGCLNYVNLALAQGTQRSRQVGILKVLGNSKQMIFSHFMIESVLQTLLAVGFAFVLLEVALPWLNDLSGISLSLATINVPLFVTSMIMCSVLIGFLAGLYPALVTSRFQPSMIMSGHTAFGNRSGWLRTSLVFVQFLTVSVLLATSLLMWRQLAYMTKNTTDADNERLLVMTIPMSRMRLSFDPVHTAIRDQLECLPGVVSMASSDRLPFLYDVPMALATASGDSSILVHTIGGGDHYIESLGLNLIAGHSFADEAVASVQNAIILNQRAAASLGGVESIGRTFYNSYPNSGEDPEERVVVGIVEDFHLQSKHNTIPAVMLERQSYYAAYYLLRINKDRQASVVLGINRAWKEAGLETCPDIQFLSDIELASYRSDRHLQSLLQLFTTVLLVIATIGLLAMSLNTVNQRQSEIAIRKVFGAEAPVLLVMILGNFLRPVILANLLAIIPAIVIMQRWLMHFAYHVEIGPVPFLAVTLFSLILATLAVLVQVLKLVRTNPVKLLRQTT